MMDVLVKLYKSKYKTYGNVSRINDVLFPTNNFLRVSKIKHRDVI
jgi:hypothetical protein